MKGMKSDKRQKTLSDTLHDDAGESVRLIRRAVKIGCAVNILLMCAKLTAGYFGHSDALMADGYHSINDIGADLIMLFFVGLSYRTADSRFPYGYGKFQTFASFLIALLLLFIASMVIFEAIESITAYCHGEILPRPDIWTLVVVVVAMACKEGLFRFYSYTGRKAEAPALLASAWHHRSDALASIATLIGVGCAYFFGEWARIFDPVASVVIAVFIIIPALRIVSRAYLELMDHSLPPADIDLARRATAEAVGEANVTAVRGRRNGHCAIFDIDVEAPGNLTLAQAGELEQQIMANIRRDFCRHAVISVTIRPSHLNAKK